jgi:hypothetical protein
MTNTQALCGFKPPKNFGDPDYQCRHPARQDGLCLFHLFKHTEEQKQAMAQEARTAAEAIEEEFRQAFLKLLEDEEKNPEAEACDFHYFHFPAIDLSQRRFAKPLRLPEATFNGVAGFERATFGENVYFWKATFNGVASFREETFKAECYFTSVTLGEKARVVLERVNLRQTSFLDTNLEQIHFRDVEWPRKGSRHLWDEFLHKGGQPDYEKVAENYRQLVLNYEAKRDFDTAEDFHIGEMEMRRKKKGKQAEGKAAKAKWRGMKTLWHCWGVIREWTNGYYLYWLASNYGTSYLQGLLVLGVLIALFSGIFLFTGLKPSKEHKDSLHDINYELCLHTACQRTSWQQKICDSARTIVFALSLLTFQKDRLYESANAWTQFWICIAVPLLAGQTALVLFAIRRRFKR